MELFTRKKIAVGLICSVILYQLLMKLVLLMCAKNLFNGFWLNAYALFMFSLLVLPFIFIIAALCKKGVWDKILNFSIIVLFFAIFALMIPNYVLATKGIQIAFNDKQKEIDVIRQWINTDNLSEISKENILELSDCPHVIRKLNPRIVYFDGNKNYIRLVWGSGVMGSYGICIGAKPEHIPLDSFYDYEYRIIVENDCFVWGQIK